MITTTKIKMLVGFVLPLMVAGCAGFPYTTYHLDDLRNTVPTGSAFTQALSVGYYKFADDERQEYDWPSMSIFADKGLSAAHGVAVPPEQLADWSIADPQARSDLAAARVRLVTALVAGAPVRLPSQAATAQVKFDCWVEEQHEGWEQDEIAACRKDFETAMTAISGTASLNVTATLPPPAAAPKPQNYLVFFDFDKSNISPDAEKIIETAASAVKSKSNVTIQVTGYTDTVGSVEYNQALSVRRASAVKAALTALGIPDSEIVATGKGKTGLLVQTGDGVREPQNRRAEIALPK